MSYVCAYSSVQLGFCRVEKEFTTIDVYYHWFNLCQWAAALALWAVRFCFLMAL